MPHVPKAVCVTCKEEMVIAGNGICVEMLHGEGDPYYKIYSDMWKCQGCGNRIYLLAEQPVAGPYDDRYGDVNASAQAHFAA